ncbi:MAG: TrmH family RNA methyltransferase [Desulfopila sp.]
MHIVSRDNKRVKGLVKLHLPKYRRQRREYLVYGRTLCAEALAAGVVTTLIFVADDQYRAADFPDKLLVSPQVMRVLADNANVEICAVCRLEERPFVSGSHVVVLDTVQDPGNLGTILRSARAFGLTNIFLSENCVDPYSIKVLRAAQGAHFSQSLRIGSLEAYLHASANSLVTTFVDEPTSFSPTPDVAYDIVFGNEGRGIRASLKESRRQNIRLEIDFESLNVAVAASIILYTTFRPISG